MTYDDFVTKFPEKTLGGSFKVVAPVPEWNGKSGTLIAITSERATLLIQASDGAYCVRFPWEGVVVDDKVVVDGKAAEPS